MASTNKTTRLQLNCWVASDKPKMEDFNSDNAIIDQSLGTHIANTSIHVTAADKSFWNDRIVTGFFVGSGGETNSINLGFEPIFVFVTAHGRPMGAYRSSDGSTYLYSAAAGGTYYTPCISLSDSGFTVSQPTTEVYQQCKSQLNVSGQFYFYIAIK